MIAEIPAHKYSKISPYVIPGLKVKISNVLNQPEQAREILFKICDYFKIPLEDITAKKRTMDLVNARYWAMWFIRAYTTLSLKQIGKMFGGLDHTTVIHGLAYIRGQLSSKHSNLIQEQYQILIQVI